MSFCRTSAGRVFLISEPSTGSNLTCQISPRWTVFFLVESIAQSRVPEFQLFRKPAVRCHRFVSFNHRPLKSTFAMRAESIVDESAEIPLCLIGNVLPNIRLERNRFLHDCLPQLATSCWYDPDIIP